MWRTSGRVLLSEAVDLGRRLLSAAPLGSTFLVLNSLDGLRYNHMRHVARLAGRAATRLDLVPDELWALRRAALLHDFGKMVIPASILNKPGKLSESEWRIVRRHPEIGAGLLSGLGESRRVCEVVAAHHERWDGHGYPAGLAGQNISIEARLIVVADAYDAMTSDRSYREALDHEMAIEQLYWGVRNQFDPDAVAAVEVTLS
jgi:putative nucleotidyltransferase with HDIG domain